MPQREPGSRAAARVTAATAGESVRAMAQKTANDQALQRDQSAQSAQMVQSGLGAAQQQMQHEDRMGLEKERTKLQAADRSLEYDPEKKIYRPSIQRQQREKAETEAIQARTGLEQKADQRAEARLNLDRDKLAADKQQFGEEMKVKRSQARTAWENAVTARQRESRLVRESRLKGEEEHKAALQKVEDNYRGRIKDLNSRMDRVKFKELDAADATNSPFQQLLMERNPEYAATVEKIKKGEGTEQEYSRMFAALEAERDMEYIGLAAETGKIATHNLDTPTMKKFMLFRQGVKANLNQIVGAQMRAMTMMGMPMAGGLTMFGGDVEQRELMVNRMSAELFRDMEFLNSERAGLDEILRANQSNVDTGGAGPAVTGGPQELQRRQSERNAAGRQQLESGRDAYGSPVAPGAFIPDAGGYGQSWGSVR